ncbi:hypothetical protein [Plantactinospora sp. WMMB782]|uniref:hypothetical protein n=1 Tax=Plantactinospora sp. WMMB782 TaxID=3404121 RepID=UPI003B943D97
MSEEQVERRAVPDPAANRNVERLALDGGVRRKTWSRLDWRALVLVLTPLMSLVVVVFYLRLDPGRWLSAALVMAAIAVVSTLQSRLRRGVSTLTRTMFRRKALHQPSESQPHEEACDEDQYASDR